MKTINIDFLISGTKIVIPFQAICSITDKKFKGNIIIEYVPDKKALEYVDVEKHIKIITRKKLTAEELTNKVFNSALRSLS